MFVTNPPLFEALSKLVDSQDNITNLPVLVKAAITALILQSDSPEAQAQARQFIWSCAQPTEVQIFSDAPPEEQPVVEQLDLIESGSGGGWTPDPVEEIEPLELSDPGLDWGSNSESEPDPRIPEGANFPDNVFLQTPGYPEQPRLMLPNPQATHGFCPGSNYVVR